MIDLIFSTDGEEKFHIPFPTLGTKTPETKLEVKKMTNKLPPKVGHIIRLAEIIREVDGSHSLGAAALAEAILSHSWVEEMKFTLDDEE